MHSGISQGGGGGGKWRAPKDDIIQVVRPKKSKRSNSIDDEVGLFSSFPCGVFVLYCSIVYVYFL